MGEEFRTEANGVGKGGGERRVPPKGIPTRRGLSVVLCSTQRRDRGTLIKYGLHRELK